MDDRIEHVIRSLIQGHPFMFLLLDNGLPLMMQPTKVKFCLGSGCASEIVRVGDVQVKFKHVLTFILKNLRHVDLNKVLLDDASYCCIFYDIFWKIARGSLVVACGSKYGTLLCYMSIIM